VKPNQFEPLAGEFAGGFRTLPVIPPRGAVPRDVDEMLSRAAREATSDDSSTRNLLFDAYRPRLRMMCLRVWRRSCKGTIVSREDLEQEAFLVFAALLAQWSGTGSFTRYLLGTYPWRLGDAAAALIGPRDASLSDLSLAERAIISYDDEQAVQLLEDLARQFPELDRQILLLRVRDGAGVRQVADSMKVNRRTVQRRMASMRETLRDDLMARTGRDAKAQ
jgi:RNA polymerase sigma factor (sigma-70 family)